MPLPELTLRARYVFPVDAPPIESGCVRILGDRISYVGPADRTPDVELGNAAIVPGFVNAHTHLELSGLRAKDVAAPDFATWLRRVIEARRGQNAAQISHAIQRGIDASLAAGTTLVADISSGGRSWKELVRSPLRATVFCELLGLKSSRAEETVAAARQFLEWASESSNETDDATRDAATELATNVVFPDGTTINPLCASARYLPNRRLQPSLSPHAPYSTHPQLFELAASWSKATGAPICTHLAETKEELRLLNQRDGPLRDFLVSIGVWDNNWNPAGAEPIAYLEAPQASQADWLIAHGNYFSPDEIATLSRYANAVHSGASTPHSSLSSPHLSLPRRAVAFCPRTHNYFGHNRHPYPQMLAASITVCLGTDSLASTPTLSILDEMRFMHRRELQLPGAKLLHMATLAGACALRREHNCGSLTVGKFADLAVIRLPNSGTNDPVQLLLDSDEPVIRTIIGGRIVFQLR